MAVKTSLWLCLSLANRGYNYLNVLLSQAIKSRANSIDNRGANPVTHIFSKCLQKHDVVCDPKCKYHVCGIVMIWLTATLTNILLCSGFKSMTVTSYQQIAVSSVLKQSSWQFLSELSGVQHWLPWVLHNPPSDTLYKCNFSTCMSILHK